MTNLWFTSDHHFNHANIIEYCHRPFLSVEEMNETMIERWNERVNPDDTVYHLGDFCLSADPDRFLRRLKGCILLVPGGHDDKVLKSSLLTVLPPLKTIKVNGIGYTLCHYPLRSWERSHYGWHHFHGHCHGTIGVTDFSDDIQLPPGQVRGRRWDVGVDCWDFYPLSIDSIIEIGQEV